MCCRLKQWLKFNIIWYFLQKALVETTLEKNMTNLRCDTEIFELMIFSIVQIIYIRWNKSQCIITKYFKRRSRNSCFFYSMSFLIPSVFLPVQSVIWKILQLPIDLATVRIEYPSRALWHMKALLIWKMMEKKVEYQCV